MKLGNQKKIGVPVLTIALIVSIFSSISAPAAVVADSNSSSGDTATSQALTVSPATASSAHWSLPFSGSLKVEPADSANIDPVTGVSHPFPVAKSYQVMKFSDKKGTPVTSPPQVFHEAIPAKVISGQITEWEGPITLERMVNHLVDTIYDRSPEGNKLDKQVKHLAGKSARAMAVTKDAFEHTFQYQGFDPSSRAGKLILDDKYKVRNIAWAEYERQKFVDKIHSQVVTNMMQLAEGIGMQDPASGAPVISTAKGALEALVGEEETPPFFAQAEAFARHRPVLPAQRLLSPAVRRRFLLSMVWPLVRSLQIWGQPSGIRD